MKRPGKRLTKAEAEDVRLFIAMVEGALLASGATRIIEGSTWTDEAIARFAASAMSKDGLGSIVGADWRLETAAGELRLHPTDIGVMCQFKDEKRAAALLFETRGGQIEYFKGRPSARVPFAHDFNHHSGKWNHHYFGPEWKGPEAARQFIATVLQPLLALRAEPEVAPEIPPCAASMGCLCAGHAKGDAADAPCNTDEHRPDLGDDDPDVDDEDCCAHCGSLNVDYAVWKNTGEVFGTFNQPDSVFCNDCEGGEDGENRLISKGVDPKGFAKARARWAKAERIAAKLAAKAKRERAAGKA